MFLLEKELKKNMDEENGFCKICNDITFLSKYEEKEPINFCPQCGTRTRKNILDALTDGDIIINKYKESCVSNCSI